MDLLKRVQQVRSERGLNIPKPINSLPTPSLEISHLYIIENKPKHKILRKYFEDMVQKAIDEDE